MENLRDNERRRNSGCKIAMKVVAALGLWGTIEVLVLAKFNLKLRPLSTK